MRGSTTPPDKGHPREAGNAKTLVSWAATSAGSFIAFAWNSPTATSWASAGTRVLSLVVFLPLLLHRLQPAEVAVWYLFSTMMALQTLGDFGFAPTFIRLISYASADADKKRTARVAIGGTPLPEIWATMQVIYFRLALVTVALLATAGTLALHRPIGMLPTPTEGWLGWLIILVVSLVTLRGSVFAAWLQGRNQVALLRRWEAITNCGSILTLAVILASGGGLLAIVTASQAWVLSGVLRDWWLFRHAGGHTSVTGGPASFGSELFREVWPNAMRSGFGSLMSRGLTFSTGPIYAQFATATALAEYMLAFRLIQVVSEFSQGPFYSKIPSLAKLHALGQVDAVVNAARVGMRRAYWTFAIAFLGVAITAPFALAWIRSNTGFVPQGLWALLGLAFFAERYGAMHIQLYSITNHIVWHVANGGAALVNLIVLALLAPIVGVYALPTAVLAGNAGFYCWYSARYVYRSFPMVFWSFEKGTSMIPAALMLAFALGALMF